MTHPLEEAVEEIVRALERHYGPLNGRKRRTQLASEVLARMTALVEIVDECLRRVLERRKRASNNKHWIRQSNARSTSR